VRALRNGKLADAGAVVQAVVAQLRAQMAVVATVDVRCSAEVTVPMLIGWHKPLIVLPLETARTLTPGQLRAILAHELAHVRRSDYVSNLMQVVDDTLFFHHPGARWVSHRIRSEREYCCDDVAVGIEKDTGAYARALAALEDARGEYRLAVAAAAGTLLDRIQRIVGQPRPMLTPARGVLALVITSLLAAIMLAVTMIVPPSLPAGSQMRRRSPLPPAGALPRGTGEIRPRSPIR
jgi:beta-lactamase regulating signal transducer with metallopeptidase domain